MASYRLALLLALAVLAGCSRAGYESARTAIESLKQVRAATQVGMTYEQYSSLVIAAKAKVNDALENLSDEDPLKEELNVAMNCYADGVTIWQMKLDGTKIFMNNPLVAKYPVESNDLYTDDRNVGTDRWHWANPDAVLQSALASGDLHLSKAIAVLNQR